MTLLRDRLSLDTTGSAAAAVCAAHCIGTPLLLTLGVLPAVGPVTAILISPLFEWGFVVLSAILGIASLVPSFTRVHRDVVPGALFAAGFGLLLIGRLFQVSEVAERAAISIAAALMVGGHLLNRRQCARCRTCSECVPST
jgi:hypothetical protein